MKIIALLTFAFCLIRTSSQEERLARLPLKKENNVWGICERNSKFVHYRSFANDRHEWINETAIYDLRSGIEVVVDSVSGSQPMGWLDTDNLLMYNGTRSLHTEPHAESLYSLNLTTKDAIVFRGLPSGANFLTSCSSNGVIMFSARSHFQQTIYQYDVKEDKLVEIRELRGRNFSDIPLAFDQPTNSVAFVEMHNDMSKLVCFEKNKPTTVYRTLGRLNCITFDNLRERLFFVEQLPDAAAVAVLKSFSFKSGMVKDVYRFTENFDVNRVSSINREELLISMSLVSKISGDSDNGDQISTNSEYSIYKLKIEGE